MSLTIKDLKPSEVVHIVDADLAVEFSGTNLVMPSTKEEIQIKILTFDNPVSSHIQQGDYMFFKFAPEENDVVIKLKPSTEVSYLLNKHQNLNNDVDLFVSLQPQATKENHNWSSLLNGINQIEIPKGHEILYISVFGFEESIFTLIVEKKDNFNQGHSLQNTSASSSSNVMEGGVECEVCHKTVPEFSYRRHLQHCKTRNWTCPNCNEVMIQEEKEKHEFMHHQSMVCDCGTEVFGELALNLHKKLECSLREVECLFCSLKFSASEIDEHQQMCGSRTEACPICQQFILLRELQDHCLAHGFMYKKTEFESMQNQVAAAAENKSVNIPKVVPKKQVHETRHNWEPRLKKKVKRRQWVCNKCDTLNRPVSHNCWKCHKPKQ